jgi:hypothetical protein
MSLLRTIGAIFGLTAPSGAPESPIPKLETQVELRFTISRGDSSRVVDIGPDHVTIGEGPCYVYFHRDVNSKVFYVGKGTGRRSHSKHDRDTNWHTYVNERSGGKYTIQIVSRHATGDEAEEAEGRYISLYGAHLTNWINPCRQIDLDANNRYLQARKTNQELMAEARPLEATDPEKAIAEYRRAMLAMYEYERIVIETGLIAELMGDRNKGDAHVLDRLTLCLSKLGRHDELDAAVVEFQGRFPNCYPSTTLTAILKRHNRVRALLQAIPAAPPKS